MTVKKLITGILFVLVIAAVMAPSLMAQSLISGDLTGTVTDACTTPERSGRTPDASGDVTKGTWPPERSVGCYWPHHKGVFDLGIDGWWPDEGDPLDIPSRLVRNRMHWEGPQLDRPNERPYALHRNGYAGMQRYASFLQHIAPL